MLKLVVLLCAAVAAVVAEPGALLAAPLVAPFAYSSAVVAPASTTITQQASSVVHPPSPYYASYAAPYLAHFIKKRSAPLLAAPYYASLPATAAVLPAAYSYASPVLPALPAAPLLPQAPLVYSHFIKKRSAPLFAAAVVAPTSYSHQSRVDVQHHAPLITSYSTPLTYASPFAYTIGK